MKCTKKFGMTHRPQKPIKNNAWLCKALTNHQIPAESNVRVKSSTMTESLSYGRLPIMQVRSDLIIKSESLHLIKLKTSS